jgi:hypothetical protein
MHSGLTNFLGKLSVLHLRGNHHMLIDEKALKHWIDHFYGYGSWDAKVWFIGYEEHGGETPEEVSEMVGYFSKAHSGASEPTLCDIREMHRHRSFRREGRKSDLYNNHFQYRFDTNAVLHGTWKNMTAFVHALKNEKTFDVYSYQKELFASAESNEALIELYPLPSPHKHTWYYNWLDVPRLPFLRSRKLYQDHLYERRMNTILSNITTYRPEVVLMYGMDNINNLKTSIANFFNVRCRLVQASSNKIPQHHIAEIGDTKMIITTQIPALRHNRQSSAFDWWAFGETIRTKK